MGMGSESTKSWHPCMDGNCTAFIVGSAVLLLVPHVVHFLWRRAVPVRHLHAHLHGAELPRGYPRYTAGALLMPVLVVVLAIANLVLLVTVFFFMAALHVSHQAGYVADSYD